MCKISKRNKYLVKNMTIFALGSISTKLISFFLVPLYTNALNTEQYGIADLITTTCIVLAPILICNISESVMRFALDKNEDRNRIMSTGLICLSFAVVVGLFIIPVARLFDGVSTYAIYIYLYTVTIAGSQLLLSYLRGKEQLVAYSIANIINTVLIAFFNILFLMVFQLGLQGYFMAYILAFFITSIYAFWVGDVKSIIRHFKFDKLLSKEMIKYSIVMIPNTFMWWISNSSDRVMVTAMINAAANGIYAVSYKLPSIVSVVSGIFNQAWGYSAVHENDSEDRNQYIRKIYNSLVFITVLTAVMLNIIMQPFLKIYVEPSYYIAWKYTPYLNVGNVFLTLGTFLGTPYFVNKNSLGYLLSATCGATANLVLNYFFIPTLGVTGAALATCISYFTVFAYRAIDSQRYIKIKILNIRHLIAYAMLILSGITMFVDGINRIILFSLEFFIVVILFKETWMVLFKTFRKEKRKDG